MSAIPVYCIAALWPASLTGNVPSAAKLSQPGEEEAVGLDPDEIAAAIDIVRPAAAEPRQRMGVPTPSIGLGSCGLELRVARSCD
jgi:hypothetical protein